MKAILIDPETQIIKEIQVNKFEDLHRAMNCSFVERIFLGQSKYLYVDEDSKLHNPTHFFTLKRYSAPIAGKGVIVQEDRQGKFLELDILVSEVKEFISFTKLKILQTKVATSIQKDAMGREIGVVEIKNEYGPAD